MASRIVVLTGGIGCGKSAAAREFESLGIEVVDADAIAHQLTAAGGKAIAKIGAIFGKEMITECGSLNRAAMRQAIFSDPDKKIELEEILHPLIRNQAITALQAAPGPYVVYMAPLWLEKYGPSTGQRELAGINPEAIIVIDCAEETQIRRVMARSGLSQNEVRAIMSHQMSRQERCSFGDFVINNDGPEELLREKIAAVHRSLAPS